MPDRESVSRRAMLVAGSVGLGSLLGRPEGVNRQEVLTTIDGFARHWGVYTAYQLEPAEYIGTIQEPDQPPGIETLGYEYNPLAAVKYHPETEETDDGSWRRVDPANPRWQWHVHIWDRDGGTYEVFSHYELRPDPWLVADEGTAEMHQRLRDHYNPKWDVTHPPDEANYFLGRACERIKSSVEEPTSVGGSSGSPSPMR